MFVPCICLGLKWLNFIFILVCRQTDSKALLRRRPLLHLFFRMTPVIITPGTPNVPKIEYHSHIITDMLLGQGVLAGVCLILVI